MKASQTGLLAGQLIGVHSVLAFVFISRPGTWLFADWPWSQAVIAFGYSCMVWVAICAAVGAYLPAMLRKARGEQA